MHANAMVWGRRGLSLVLAAALLAGCAGFSLPDIFGKPVTLGFLYFEGTANYQPLADEFHRLNPGITVQLIPVTYDNFQSLAADADVIRLPNSVLTDDLVKNLLTLDSQISTDPNFPKSDLFPGSLEALQLGGKQIAIPAGLEPMVVYYSPQKFTAAGIKPPSPDWTLKEFVQAAVAVNNQNEVDRFTYGFCSNAVNGLDALVFTYLFGGGIFDDDLQPARPMLDRRENADALTWYASLYRDFKIMPDVGTTYLLAQTVQNHYCGFWFDSITHQMYGDDSPSGTDSAAMLPLPDYNAPFPMVFIDAYAITAGSKNPQAAWQWLMFLVQSPQAAGRLIPPLKTRVLAEGNPSGLPADVLAVANHLPARLVPISMETFRNQSEMAVWNTFFDAATEVFKGRADAQSALNHAQRLAQQEFQK